MTKVDIGLINYKNWEDTIKCLESITNSDYKNIAVNIIDIQNIDDSVFEIENYLKNYPIENYFYKSSLNNGFAYANNLIMRNLLSKDNTEFIWLLNNDTLIYENTITELVSFFDKISKQEKVGILGSMLVNFEDSSVIQSLGGVFNPKIGKVQIVGKNKSVSDFKISSDFKPDFVTGAAMFFHKSLINDIGYMPEEYFMYYEDIDWCFSALKKGYKNFICVNSIVKHKQGASTGNKYDKKSSVSHLRKYMYINYKKFYKKHFSKYSFLAYFWLLKQFFGRLFKFNFKEAGYILNSIFNNQVVK